jgi:hypothetical protein
MADKPKHKIIGWDDNYENNRTRTMKKMQWVALPNSFDGDRISELIGELGADGYGAWCAVLAVASRCDTRGVLVRTTGQPHDSKSLSRITGIDAKSFDKMFPIALRIGLIEAQTIDNSDFAGGCQEGDRKVSGDCHPTDEEGTEGTERKEGTEDVCTEPENRLDAERARTKEKSEPLGFTRWWQVYPNRTDKQRALSLWCGRKPLVGGDKQDLEPLSDKICAAVEAQRKWRVNAGPNEFRPEWKGAATWLYNGCWQDDVGEKASTRQRDPQAAENARRDALSKSGLAYLDAIKRPSADDERAAARRQAKQWLNRLSEDERKLVSDVVDKIVLEMA